MMQRCGQYSDVQCHQAQYLGVRHWTECNGRGEDKNYAYAKYRDDATAER